MRSMRVPALVAGVVLLSSAAGITWTATQSASDAAGAQNTELRTAAANTEVLITEEFERAGAIGLLSAQDDGLPATSSPLPEPPRRRSPTTSPPASRSSTCSCTGRASSPVLSHARVWWTPSPARRSPRWSTAPPSPPLILEPNADKKLPFFGDVMSLPVGWLYQSTPYFSKETSEWVIANGTTVTVDGDKRGVLYFELDDERPARARCWSARVTPPCALSPSETHSSSSTVA